MSKKTHIIIHHSYSQDNVTRDWDGIRRYHIEHNGWRDVGYHYGVERVRDGYVIQKGREEWDTGAHTVEQSMNRLAFGVCCVGKYDEKEPPPGMYEKTAELCADLCKRHGIPVQNIRPHREFAINKWTGKPYKSCPGWAFDMDKLRQMVSDILGGNEVDNKLNLTINGRLTDVPLKIIDGRTHALLDGHWVRLRTLAELLHARIGWDKETQTVSFTVPPAPTGPVVPPR